MTRTEPQDLAARPALDHAECLRTLGPGRDRPGDLHGRGDAGGPTGEVPLVAGEVILRTGGGQLAAATNNAVVAFEVDDGDIATRTGWSVLAVGTDYRVSDRDWLSEVTSRVPRSWAPRHNGAHHRQARPASHRAPGRRGRSS